MIYKYEVFAKQHIEFYTVGSFLVLIRRKDWKLTFMQEKTTIVEKTRTTWYILKYWTKEGEEFLDYDFSFDWNKLVYKRSDVASHHFTILY